MNNNFMGVIVDAGHGGIDSGAVGNGLQEKDLTLEAAKYIYKRLQELGIPAKMTREEDIYLPKQDRISKVLSLYNNNPNTILISNHINAGGAEGAEVVYALKNNDTLANLVLDNLEEAGQLKRKVYQRRLPENPNKDYYYILRETGNTEPILIEYGFIDNQRDATKLKNNITKYAEAVVKAIAEYLGYDYFIPGNTSDNYIVQKGDTLYSISKRFNIPVEEIKRINNLKSNDLSIGQVLYFESISDSEDIVNDTFTYTVEKGDTLYGIAQKFDTTVEEIKRMNKLNSNSLVIGQSLLLPDKEIKDDLPSQTYDIYIVKKGDSLWKIARMFNIPVPKLIEINNLDDLTLQVDQKLLVPISSLEDTYTVEKGDTLWSIAKKNNIDVSYLKELNNLTSNLLSVGQVLKIK